MFRYVSYMTEEYSNIFTQYGEQLETIAYRLAWIKRVVAKYEHSHATVFPVEWQVMETLITKCCDLVSQDVQRVVGTLKPHEHHILQTQLQEAIGLEEVLASKITKKNMDFGLVTAFEPVIYLIIAEHDNALSAFISGLEVKKASPSVHITSNLDRECVYEIWKSGLELWERSENALQDVACVSTGKPLVRVLQVIDDAITDYAQYVMRIQGKKKYRPHILVTSMNTVSYVFRLRTEEDSSIGYGMELCITQTIKQLASQLANTLVSGEEEMKAERLEEVLSQVLSTSAREEVAEAFIRQAVAGISKQINSKMWSVEGAAQRRLQLSAYSDDIRAVLPFTTRSIWSHAVQPLDDLLCILMTPLEENHDALVDLYLLKSSPYGFTNQEDFARRMGLREDWQRQKKLLLASFLKKVPPKPSQLNN